MITDVYYRFWIKISGIKWICSFTKNTLKEKITRLARHPESLLKLPRWHVVRISSFVLSFDLHPRPNDTFILFIYLSWRSSIYSLTATISVLLKSFLALIIFHAPVPFDVPSTSDSSDDIGVIHFVHHNLICIINHVVNFFFCPFG